MTGASPCSVAKAPCKSCPYRQDVPSGVWSAEEYLKLPKFDGDILDQLLDGAGGLFMCHQKDGNLCAGWLATHGPANLLAVRVAKPGELADEVFTYRTDVPVFDSGLEAARHGIREIKNPGPRAKRIVGQLIRKRGL